MLRACSCRSRGTYIFSLQIIDNQPDISGFSFGYSVFLNSHFLGSGQGSSHSQDGVDLLSPSFNFTQDQLVPGGNGGYHPPILEF
jgi:hypothetical protein